ncbi:hypothetical protein SAMN06295905_1875 [Devosia lucknowensis]|uniref:Uncharacterized protein n=1 Tax=Devosia lucknowensis TaxID=1096929 RepID=A0A1Y6F9N7_9HYPH|nr:hypothetical protein [Devosia lucknowensis]SMQ70301.1 hypothetical protein SAMN06295905_1875 [Devosia lucknowensis]
MIRIVATLAVLLGGTTLATAQDIQAEIEAFTEADGFERLDLDLIEKVLLDQFFDVGEIAPGGSIGPIEKALIVATAEIPSVRTRTALSYGEIVTEEDGAVSFIEVRHYNLGPAIRADLIEAYGEGDVADEEAFGMGDHMAWRFVFQPLMGNSAALIDVSNKVIPEKSAAKHDCDGRPCLDYGPSLDEMADWEPMTDIALPDWEPLYPQSEGGLATPAFAVSQLAVVGFWANAEGGDYQWTGSEPSEAEADAAPFRFISIDRNLGNEDAIDTVWREVAPIGYEGGEVLFRRAEVGGQVSWMQAWDTP